jgi:hypothetical protein
VKKNEKDKEERQSKIFIKQILERKQIEEAMKEAHKKYTEEALQQRYEENMDREYI